MDIMTKVMFIAGIVMAVAWVILYVVNMSLIWIIRLDQ